VENVLEAKNCKYKILTESDASFFNIMLTGLLNDADYIVHECFITCIDYANVHNSLIIDFMNCIYMNGYCILCILL
jgi:hypothetical protein